MPRPVTVAAFDFDHTLLKGDSMRAFLRFSVGDLTFLRKSALLSPVLMAYLAGSLPREKAKELVLTKFFGGKPSGELFDLGKQFAHRVLPSMERPEAMSRLLWHQNQGHYCIMSTASMDIWTWAWAENKGLDLIATRSHIDEKGVFTGKLEGTNNWGPGKETNLRKKLEGLEVAELYAYGDSKGDKELLAMADYPYYRTFSEK